MGLTDFENYIRKHCRQHKISLERLAEKSGVARGTLYRLLEADSSPKIEHLIALAEAMGIHHNILFRLKWQEFGVLTPSNAKSGKRFVVQENAKMDCGAFIDETVPDGTMMAAGAVFEKTWTIQNAGEVVWENRYLMCIDEPVLQNGYPEGESLDAHQLTPLQGFIPIPTTKPDQIITLSTNYQAPQIAGRYISCWKMVNEHGELCFPHGIGLSVSILVRGFGVSF